MQRARKFSVVFGTTSPNKPRTMRPPSPPAMSTSKNTLFVTFGPSLFCEELENVCEAAVVSY